ncbi:MAG: hypothetical protein J0L92_00485 [Deltaproteobacteria bacterium]|nr:hypothetical protein [Deltaproteobacteria bacterium]
MNGHHDDFDPTDDALLADFVDTLRGATPAHDVLAPVRRTLVGAPRRGTPWLTLVIAIAALGLGTSGPGIPRTIADRRAPQLGVIAPSPAVQATRVAEAIPAIEVDAVGEWAPATDSDPWNDSPSTVGSERTAPLRRVIDASLVIDASPVIESDAVIESGLVLVSERQHEASPVIDSDHLASSKSSASPPPTGPTPLFADAARFVASDRCAEAAPLLSRIIEGETTDAPEHVEQAELALARCLFTLGYVTTSASIVDGIAQRQDHRGRVAALELIARLGERLPDPRGVVASISHYELPEIERADAQHRGTLRYLLARARYDAGELEAAAQLFVSVPRGHRFYVPARYLEGMSHVRARHAVPAIAAFEAVIEAVGGSAGEGSGERDRYRDLARLAIARVRYTAARPAETGDDPRRTQLLGDALASWQEIPFGSEAGLDAFFEESWALYLLDESPRALGHVHALLAPQLRGRPHPEALVLRATIYFEHCRFEAARRTVDDFHARFDPLLVGLERTEHEVEAIEAAYALLDAVRSDRGPRGEIGEVVRAALDDRELARLLVSVRAIDAEEDRLAHAPVAMREGSLGTRIAQELALARSFTVELGGRLVRERLARVTGSLRDHANEIDTVALEIDTRTRLALEQGEPLTSEPERPVSIVAVQGDQIWPFDGEYWEDELPYYRELVTDLCVR